MTDREAMQLALEALENVTEDYVKNRQYKHNKAIAALEKRLAQPEQELVIDCPRCGHCCPQRTWVDLTDEEIMEPWPFENRIAFARRLGAKLKEKNT